MAEVLERNILVRFTADSKQSQKATDDLKKKVGGLNKIAQDAAATFAGLFAFNVGASLVNGIKGLATGAIEAAASFEQTKIAFETFLGDAGTAREVIDELNEFSVATPFEPEQVLSAGKALLAFGVDADKLTDSLGKIGDISAGTGKDFNDLAVIFGKARVSGTLFAEDINQLTEAGIPVIQEFAQQLGVGTDEVKKLASEGKISFENLEQAFSDLTAEGGRFNNLTLEQSKSLNGLLSTLRGAFRDLLRQLGERLLPTLKEIVSATIDFIKNFDVNTVIRFAKAIGTIIAAIVSYRTVVAATTAAQNAFRVSMVSANLVSALFSSGITKARTAMIAFNTAVKANPLAAFTSLVTLAAGAIFTLETNTAGAAEAQRELTAEQQRALDAAGEIDSIERAVNQREQLNKKQLEGVLQRIKTARDAEEAAEVEILGITAKVRAQIQEIRQSFTEEQAALERNSEEALLKDALRSLDVGNAAEVEANKKRLNGFQGLINARIAELNRGDKKAAEARAKRLELEAKWRDDILDLETKLRLELDEENKQALEAELERVNKLLAEQLEIDKKAREAAAKSRRDFAADTEEDEEQTLADTQARLDRAFDIASREIEREILAQEDKGRALLDNERLTQEQRRSLVEDTAREIELLEIQRLEAQLSTLEIGSENELSLIREINNRKQALREEDAAKAKAIVREQIEDAKRLGEAVLDIANQLNANRIANIDAEIQGAQDKVAELEKINTAASDSLIKLEKQRLEQLNEERAKAQRAAARIAALEIAVNTALAVSQGILATTSAFKEGNIIKGIATSIALVAQVTTSILAIKQAFQNLPAFAQGTEFFDGKGTGTSDSNLALISRGERIVPADINAKYYDTLNEFQKDSTLARMLDNIAKGNINTPKISSDTLKSVNTESSNMQQLNTQLIELNKKFDRLQMNVRLDKDGFSASMLKHIDRKKIDSSYR